MAATAAWKLTAVPATLEAGKDYSVSLTLPDDNCAAGAKPFDAVNSVTSSSPKDLATKDFALVANTPCTVVVPVTVASTTLAGNYSLFLQPKPPATTVLGMVSLKILSSASIPPGPVPPGLAPQLDIMWKILPRHAVADSYGSRVADNYFAVEATFGNDTGYDLQVAALGFIVPTISCEKAKPNPPDADQECWLQKPEKKSKKKKAGSAGSTADGTVKVVPQTQADSDKSDNPVIPVDAYPVVRGTVEREQSVGTRAIVVNLVKATGPILVGVGGAYFNSTGEFYNGATIFSSFFEKGLELVYPDLTTNHLINLDNRTLRDGAVIPNNSSMRINAFISRELVQCGPRARWYSFGNRIRAHDVSCTAGDTRLPFERDFRPEDVIARLGKLVLIGQQVQYLNRIRVIQDSNSSPSIVSTPQAAAAAPAGNAPATGTTEKAPATTTPEKAPAPATPDAKAAPGT